MQPHLAKSGHLDRHNLTRLLRFFQVRLQRYAFKTVVIRQPGGAKNTEAACAVAQHFPLRVRFAEGVQRILPLRQHARS